MAPYPVQKSISMLMKYFCIKTIISAWCGDSCLRLRYLELEGALFKASPYLLIELWASWDCIGRSCAKKPPKYNTSIGRNLIFTKNGHKVKIPCSILCKALYFAVCGWKNPMQREPVSLVWSQLLRSRKWQRSRNTNQLAPYLLSP